MNVDIRWSLVRPSFLSSSSPMNADYELTEVWTDQVKLGMTLLGLVFSSILYGITICQTYAYYQRFPLDPFSVKFMVVALTILDTVSASLITHCSCWINQGVRMELECAPKNISLVLPLTIGVKAELALSMVISGLVELFLVYRVWLLSDRNRMLAMFLASPTVLSLAIVHFISGEYTAAAFFRLHMFSRFGVVTSASIIRLVSAAVCDTAIAVAMCFFLHRKRTGYKKTDKVIDHLIIFSINTGLLTSVASIACLITYLLVPQTWVYLGLCFLISKLYANTFLSSLNSRQILRENLRASETITISDPAPDVREITTEKRLSNKSTGVPNIDVYVVTETIIRGENDPRVSTNTSQRPLVAQSDSSSSRDHSQSDTSVA
ncbi:hypothetical protein C8J56DRAFT_1040155 [Mycena floridula]|nr:hypothetical protein C8J56DRAFT_1040155 [Mycena floridula]